MDKEELIEYLKIVLDLEETIYIRNTLIEEFKNDIRNLYLPVKPNKPVEPILYVEDVIPGKRISLNERNKMIQRNHKAEIEYKKQMLSYNRSLVQYQTDIDKYNQKEQEYRLSKDYLSNQIKILELANKKSTNILQSIYDKGLLYSKYRNLFAASKILEYIESGRCETLEGPNGAYEKLESENRVDTMIGNQKDAIVALNNINNSLNRLANSITYLGDMVKEGNKITSQMYKSVKNSLNEIKQNQISIKNGIDQENRNLNKIKSNLSLIQFNTNATMKEAKYLRQVKEMNDGKWFTF